MDDGLSYWLSCTYSIRLQLTSSLSLYLESIVGPAAELHDAGLLVEGEVLHVHLAGGVVDGGRLPLHPPLVVQGRLRGQRHLKVPVRTGEKGEESAVLYTVQ